MNYTQQSRLIERNLPQPGTTENDSVTSKEGVRPGDKETV
jgi:hypothetical protein